MAEGESMGGLAASLGPVQVERAGQGGRVMVLRVQGARPNGLDAAMISALSQALSPDGPDPAEAVVIAAEGRDFSAGVDLGEARAEAPDSQGVADLAAAIEADPRPIIFALQGLVAGRAAELALAACARVASRDMRLVWPDVALGLAPEAGATQRLPRLIGAESSLRLLLDAWPLPAAEAAGKGLIDHLVDQPAQLESAAIQLAEQYLGRDLATKAAAVRAPGLAWPAEYLTAVAQARARHGASPVPASARIIDCVEAALCLPLANGLAMEAAARADLWATPEARALHAIARAERRHVLTAETHPARAPRLGRLRLIGAGPAGLTLGRMAARAGLVTTLVEADPDRRARAMAWAAAHPLPQGGWLVSDEDASMQPHDMVLIEASTNTCAPAAVVSHDGPVFTTAATPAPRSAALAMSPSGRMVELAHGAEGTEDQRLRDLHALRRIGLQAVSVGHATGLGARIVAAGAAAVVSLQELGIPPALIDAALAPLRALAPSPKPDAGRAPLSLPEIRQRWLAALAAEGLRALGDGQAVAPSDIDHLMVNGHGFARWHGGPMHQAQTRGTMVLLADLRRWEAEGACWQVPPLLLELHARSQQITALEPAF